MPENSVNHPEPRSEKNLSGYGAPNIPWSDVRDSLSEGVTQTPETGGPQRHTHWLATARPDGRPHVMPLGALWIDGAFYFTAGPGTRKAKNLARDPRCVLTVATHDFDLVVEGEATRVLDEAQLQRIAAEFASGGWEPTVRDEAFYAEYSAPSAGPPPWYVFEIVPQTVFALGTSEPYGATRWRFDQK